MVTCTSPKSDSPSGATLVLSALMLSAAIVLAVRSSLPRVVPRGAERFIYCAWNRITRSTAVAGYTTPTPSMTTSTSIVYETQVVV